MGFKNLLLATAISCVFLGDSLCADQQPSPNPTTRSTTIAANAKKREDGLVPLNKQETVLLDLKGKRVLLKSKVEEL